MKVKTCSVPNCTDSQSIRHRFPKNDEGRSNMWITIIGREDLRLKNLEGYRVCHRHFEDKFSVPGTKRLHQAAVPTINVPGCSGTTPPLEPGSFATPINNNNISEVDARKIRKEADIQASEVVLVTDYVNLSQEDVPKAEENASSFVESIMEGPEVEIVDDDDDTKNEVEMEYIAEETSDLDDVVDRINRMEKVEVVKKEELLEHSYCKEMDGLCRLCQANEGTFSITSEDGLYENIVNYIKIDVSSVPEMPQLICSGCKTLIDTFHKFVLNAHYVNKQLENAYAKVQTDPHINNYQERNDINDTNLQSENLINNEDESITPMLKCRLCDLSFSINEYFTHVKKTHQIIYRCGIKSCQQSFSSKGNLQRHMNRHIYKRERFRAALLNREFECQICKKAFGTKTILIRHRKHHYNFKCPVKDCDSILKNWHTFETHIRLHGDRRRNLCHICGKTYSTSTSFLAHEQSHSGKKQHACKFCNRRYTTKAILTNHIRIKHEGVKYYCSKCPNSYATRMNLIFHERVHTGNPTYKCGLCPKAFYRKSRLDIHLQTHEEGKPYECRVCAKAFKLETSRKTHERIHLGEKFNCTVPGCNKIFTRTDRVKNHLRNKHPEEYKVAYGYK